jgi:hypothetical protein
MNENRLNEWAFQQTDAFDEEAYPRGEGTPAGRLTIFF